MSCISDSCFLILVWWKNVFQLWNLEMAPEMGSGTDPFQRRRNVMLELPLGDGGIMFSKQFCEMLLLTWNSWNDLKMADTGRKPAGRAATVLLRPRGFTGPPGRAPGMLSCTNTNLSLLSWTIIPKLCLVTFRSDLSPQRSTGAHYGWMLLLLFQYLMPSPNF